MMTPAGVDFLRQVDTPTVANAIERLAVRDRTDGFIGGSIRAIVPPRQPMVGRAVTVEMTSRPGPVAGRAMYWEMWEAVAAEAASVLVVKDVSGTPARCAYIGEVMARIAMSLGCVGFVTDAGVRDLDEVEAIGFPLFGAFVVASHGNFEVIAIGREVDMDGQPIRPGDLLHGDRNGIVVVPEASIATLPDAIQEIRASESADIAFIGSEAFDLATARSRAGY
jgi:4-hydroxy-4-methyl-2-oxoglutarate aldolase